MLQDTKINKMINMQYSNQSPQERNGYNFLNVLI